MFEAVGAVVEQPPDPGTDPFTDLPLTSSRPRRTVLLDPLLATAGDAPTVRPDAPPVHPLVAQLQAAVSALARAQAEGTLAAGSLVDTAALLRTAERVAGLALVEVAAVDRHKSHLSVGRASTAGWMSALLTVDEQAARAKVTLARRLTEDLSPIGELLVDGGTTVAHCAAMTGGLRGITPDVVADSTAPLITLARTLDPPALHRELRERALAVSPQLAAEQQRRQRQRCGVTASELPDGCVSLHGLLEPEPGQALLAALDALVHGDRHARTADGERDDRDAPTRRADALAALAGHALDCQGLLPGHGGMRALVHVLVPAQTLLDPHPEPQPGLQPGRAAASTPARFAGSGALLTRQQLLRLTCDADVSRVVLDPDGAVVDLGRLTRTVTPAQWRALVARDHGCVIRGCHRRPAQTQAHHVQHWAHGGPSDLSNYALVCHLHHHQLHDGHQRLPHRDGRWLTPHGYTDPDPPAPF